MSNHEAGGGLVAEILGEGTDAELSVTGVDTFHWAMGEFARGTGREGGYDMRLGRSVSRSMIVVAAGVAALCFLPWCAAQDAAPGKTSAASKPTPSKLAPGSKPTPRTPDGHPDLSGFYNLGDIFAGDPVQEKPGQHVVVRSADGSVFFDYGGANAAGSEQVGTKVLQTQNGKVNLLDRTCVSCEEPPYKQEYMAKVKAIGDAMHGDASPADPQYDCIPYGVPRGSLRGGGGYAMQIVQNSQVVAFLYEDRPGPYFRIVYLDGRPHPKDLDSSYYGDSIGHWEGDTLVVDVVGLNDETWLGSGTVGPKLAMMHSDQLHVIERWTRAGDVLTYEATVEDPVMFTKPWVMTPRQTQIAAPGDYIRPTMCLPLDKSHLVKEDETPYASSKDAAEHTTVAATTQTVPNIAGSWNVQIYSTIEGMMNQQWVMKQQGSKVTGTVTSKSGEMPLEGTLEGGFLHATVTDGQKKYDVRATVVAKDLDGSIKINRNEFRLAAKQAK